MMTKTIVRSLLVLLILLLASRPHVWADQTDKENLTAEQILTRMAQVYSTCKTYQDSGAVKIVTARDLGNQTEELSFTTAFIRPNRFRYEFIAKDGDKTSQYIIWNNGRQSRSWWDVVPGIEKEQSLSFALAGATSISKGAAHTIPSLLLTKDVSSWRLTDMADVKRIEDATLDKVDCFRITGRLNDRALIAWNDNSRWQISTLIAWIDKKSFLIHRIDEQTKFDNFRMEETTTYAPEIDGNIPDKMLLFDPPKGKHRTQELSDDEKKRYSQRANDRYGEQVKEDERKMDAIEEIRKHK